ncbi:oral-facial-digital syndrome 1 protein isoform X1 [Ornithorhynchus anatinus]|uniref:oral-facial-digital syndrome 1 protein isoform X1 n=2 Tax=Ornithorhynchus anatinus TaxID=9258 RepID=UPI0010A7E501|nr:oral-facial-digital syndrome 1 protein isoform X1 [Ornithorhynchus anatinus]
MSSESEAMSPDELRKRLYRTFKDRGILDTLKTQLRNQLIHELMHPVLNGELQPKSIPVEGSSLLIGASNSLVADHLRRCGYEYSLSVFFPESGLEKEKVFTMQDLLQLIKINPKSSLYKSLTSGVQKENHKGFLMQILMELAEYHLSKESCSTGTQTNATSLYGESLAEKLQLIDEQFADIYPQRHKAESLEAKLAEYKKGIEEQLQTEMSQKLNHFKEVEIAKIRMEEKRRSQKEISQLRHEFEKTHQAKSEALLSREKNAIERLQKHQEIEAKEVYAQRQDLLKDIEIVRGREAELKQRIEAFELAQRLQEEKNKSVDDALRRRELSVKNIEDTYEQKLKNELLKYQLELKEEYTIRSNRITEEERKNKERAMHLHEETLAFNSKKEDLRQAIAHASELKLELDSVKAQVLVLTKQNHLLTEKLRETTDYPLLKEEKLEFQMQNKLLKQQLEEIRNENLHLQNRLTQPSAEHVALQAELKRAENARKLEQKEFETRKQVLEKQLQNEVEHCAQLKIELLDSETSLRRINMQVEDLKMQLRQTQTALENEVYRNPKPSVVDRSVTDFTRDKIVPHDIYTDGDDLLKNRLLSGPVVQEDGVPRTRYFSRTRTESSSPDSDLEFVANTKARVKELEKEAAFLEEAYRNYQQRVTQASVVSILPAKTQVPSLLPESLRSVPLNFQERTVFVDNKFVSEQLAHSGLNDIGSAKHASLTGNLTPQQRRVSSPRRLSSTPLPKARRSLANQMFLEGNGGSYVATPHPSPGQPPSPIPRAAHLSSATSAPSLSLPSGPVSQEQKLGKPESPPSTVSRAAAAQHSLSRKPVEQDTTEFSKPEMLGFEDLKDPESSLEFEGNIPKQLEMDVLDPDGDTASGNHVTAATPVQQGIMERFLHQQDPEVIHQNQLEEQNEEKEKKWEMERREREERRQRERQEAFEREQRELEKLEQEMKLNEEALQVEEQKEREGEELVDITETEGRPAEVNPLEKYMKIIQQSRERGLAEKVRTIFRGVTEYAGRTRGAELHSGLLENNGEEEVRVSRDQGATGQTFLYLRWPYLFLSYLPVAS